MLLIRAFACLAALALFAACGTGDGGGGGASPTPVPTATTRPSPGCGNGLVDDGELCDGEDFCTDCSFAAHFCCEVPDVDDGTACVEQSPSPHACATGPAGGVFVPGSTCEGTSCPDEGFCRHDGRCVTRTIEPASLCCGLVAGGCTATVVSDTTALANFVVFDCGNREPARASVGTCSPEGRCIPPR